MSSTYLDYLKYRYKSNKFLKIRLILPNFRKKNTPLIGGKNFLYQWCPLIGERIVVSIDLLYRAGHMYQRGTCISVSHVSAWHMYLTGCDLILIIPSYFLLKMVLVMNELHCHKKSRHLFDKNSQTIMICYNYKINNL